MNTGQSPIHVIKLGGSLLDMPDLPERFANYCQMQDDARRMVVVGGGRAADVVRMFDRHFGLNEEQGHWLAVRAMELNAHLFATVMPSARLASSVSQCMEIWSHGNLAVMDPLHWLRDEETRGVVVPHRWQFTSDSIAAHVARRFRAQRLTLLKSVSIDPSSDINSAMASGAVDQQFAKTAARLTCVEIVNLRNWPSPPSRL